MQSCYFSNTQDEEGGQHEPSLIRWTNREGRHDPSLIHYKKSEYMFDPSLIP